MESSTYISEEGFEKLKEEARILKTDKRQEISQRIEEAKKLGDLSENAEYMEAKEEQELNERKIAELEEILRTAVIISKNRKKGVVQIGSSIIVKSNGKTASFIITGSEEANPDESKISNLSPLGSSFLDKKVGDIVTVKTPAGVLNYEIVEIQ